MAEPGDRRPATFPGGAALLEHGAAWVLVEADPARSLGPALAWARSSGAEHLHLVAEAAPGLLARRAGAFARPPTVWRATGRTLAPAEPDPLLPTPPLDPEVARMADVLLAAGCDPVVEHGRLVGEVEGLEVARVSAGDDGPLLEIGVGRFDREAHAMVSADRPSAEALAEVVALVRRARRPDARPSPLRRLQPERWLRRRVVEDPSLVGAELLAPVPPVLEPPDLRTPWPAVAAGTDADGGPVVVVCSSGIDLDLVPAAADARLADGREARLVLAVAPRDAHPITRDLAATLREPAELVAVPGPRAA